ncbi:hypothetical protein MMC29_004525 [Sticta canariensis]|nr:hypothetical protein [Sticta canariensis]
MTSSDDQFIVSPFLSSFQYIAEVPHEHAIKILDKINAKAMRRDLETRDFNFEPHTDACLDSASLKARSFPLTRGLQNRQTGGTLGHHTTDDFGDTGDDTPHKKSEYPNKEELPKNLQAASDGLGTDTKPVDVIFISYLNTSIIKALVDISGMNYTSSVKDYVDPKTLNTLTYLSKYAEKNWRINGTCKVGEGVGD